MVTTREQAEAANYEGRRQASALMTGEDQARRDPRRRINRVTLAGILIAILCMAGFGIAGFLGAGRGPQLPQSGAVLVAGSGDRYVIVDGRLHPALNLASALLVGGGQIAEVRPAVLDALPRGLPVGIPDAPDALPLAERLTGEDWTVCAVPSGAPTLPPDITLRIGIPEPTAGVLGPDDALVARADDGVLWLIDRGRRYRLDGPTQVLLGLQRRAPVALPPAILDTVPEGSPIAVPQIDGTGEESLAGPGEWLAGDVVRVGPTLRGAYVVRADGLAPISEFTATLLVNAGARVRGTTVARASTAVQSPSGPLGAVDWPVTPPTQVGPEFSQPVCFSTTPGEPPGDAPWGMRVSLPGTAAVEGHDPVHTLSGDVTGIVDEVLVPRGAGALVRSATSSGGDGALTIVTDSGQRFALPTPDAATRLRYDPAAAPTVPAPFVALIPEGPPLDPDLAAREFVGR